MNLKEAYELRRQEVLRLTRENTKLKEGKFTDAEKASLEKKIKELEKQIKEAVSSIRTYKRVIASLKYEKEHQEEQISQLEHNIFDLEQAVASKEDELSRAQTVNSTLKDENARLKAQINRDYENSSKPSSDKPQHKKITNNRVKSGKKPGAQPDHEGKNLTKPQVEDSKENIQHLETPKEITDSQEWYPTGKILERSVIELSIGVNVITYTADEYRSRKTKALYHAPFPVNVVNKINYGSSVKALAFLLNNFCNVSIAKTKSFIAEVTNGLVDISTGEISNLLKEFANKTEKEQRELFDELTKAPVLYSDATGSRVNGKGKAVIVCCTPTATQFFFKDHKGHEGLKGTPVEFNTNIIVHDHDISYYSYGSKHQECLAHILRYLKDAMENEPTLTWHRSMHELLQEVIHKFKEADGKLTETEQQAFLSRYTAILDIAEKEYNEHPHAKWYPQGENLFKRLGKFYESVLLFMSHPEVEYTNNLSERNCRKYKRKKQQQVTHRSQEAAENLCKAMSILVTENSRGNNLYETTKQYFNNGISAT